MAGGVAGLVGDIAGGLGKLIGGGGSAFDRLIKLATISDELRITADAIREIGASLGDFGKITGRSSGGFKVFKEMSADLSDGIDDILSGTGNRRQRRDTLQAVASIIGSDLEDRSSNQSATTAGAATAAGDNQTPNITTAQNVQDSFNTSQVFVTDAGMIESTLAKIA